MPLDDEGWIEQFLKRLEESNIASRSELVGCSAEEIHTLEARYNVTLPQTYRWYLETMGHKSGNLFTWDHFAVSYPYVLSMTDEYRDGDSVELASGDETEFDDSEDFTDDDFAEEFTHLELPTGGLLILGRLGWQFHYIVCDNEQDTAIFYFNTDDQEVIEVFPSVKSWLESMATDAERAIASGYFEQYPGGTTP